MRNCIVCGKPTLHRAPEDKRYPAEITPEILARSAHISDEELQTDIWDTEFEIRELEVELLTRKKFLVYLSAINTARLRT